MSASDLNFVFLVWFTSALFLSSFRIWERVIRFYFLGQKVPVLLWRDAATITGLAVPFGGVLLLRVLGLNLADEIGWTIPTGLAACLGMTTFAYFEYFVIDDRRRAREDAMSANALPPPGSPRSEGDGAGVDAP
jgi:hypothetical protein